MNVKKKLKDLEQVVDYQDEMIIELYGRLADANKKVEKTARYICELGDRICDLERAQPVRIVFTEVETSHADLCNPRAKVDPSPERFEREWIRQAEFCGE